jgi:hypothetical protein
VRYVLIGRRALIVLGLPVMTVDYDLWIEMDDTERLNRAALPFELHPNRSPEDARRVGRYVLENDERVDVLVSRRRRTIDGVELSFSEVFERRTAVEIGDATDVNLPALDDLIATKRFAARPKDVEDVRMLEALRNRRLV